MIRLKQLLEQINPTGKKIATDTLKNVGKTKTWETIVAKFSKEIKSSLTKSGTKEIERSITIPEINNGRKYFRNKLKGDGILFGMTLKNGTLQNGGTSINYEKETDTSKSSPMNTDRFFIKNYYLTLTADYAQPFNEETFEIDATLKAVGRIYSDGEDENGHNRLNSGGFDLNFTILLNKDESGNVSYGIKVGNFDIEDLIIGTITGYDIANGMTTDDIVETMGMAATQGLKNNQNYCQLY